MCKKRLALAIMSHFTVIWGECQASKKRRPCIDLFIRAKKTGGKPPVFQLIFFLLQFCGET
jgi:hypothetical protein